MTLEMARGILGWCSIINMGLLLLWFFIITVTHDWVYKFHTKWFKISVEQFDGIHYAGLAFFKIFIFALNIVPYFALRIVG